MKLTLELVVLVITIWLNGGCIKLQAPIADNEELENLIYSSSCTISELFWLSDNETVLMVDHCNGTLKKINTSTKSVQFFDLGARGHSTQRLFYFEQIPQLAFYITPIVVSNTFSLFSLNLATGASVLIRDNITQNPYWGGYTQGNKKLSIKSGTELLVVDLEQATTQVLPISQTVLAFSPDDTKMLLYPSLQGPASGPTVYDFTCQCLKPIALVGTSTGKPLWRSQGLYNYSILSVQGPNDLYATQVAVTFSNLESGVTLKSFTNFMEGGPWVAQQGSLSVFMVKGPTYATDNKAVLLSFDFLSGQTKEIVTVEHKPFPASIVGIYLAAISPNQKKVAYVQHGSQLRVSM